VWEDKKVYLNRRWFFKGIVDGIPISLGYLAVSFTLGIAAKKYGLTAIQATVMSITNNTSAGQFASFSIIASGATLMELAVTQLIINLRYCLMSASLSQKLDPQKPFFHRFLVAYGVTDEIFGVSSSVEGRLNPFYTYGLFCIAAPGWALGTCLGVVSGNILPANVLSAMSIALYGMFIAVIVPPTRKNRILAGLIAVSMIASLLFTYIPFVKEISSGFRIIILTVVIAGAAAVLFPVKDENARAEGGNADAYIEGGDTDAYIKDGDTRQKTQDALLIEKNALVKAAEALVKVEDTLAEVEETHTKENAEIIADEMRPEEKNEVKAGNMQTEENTGLKAGDIREIMK